MPRPAGVPRVYGAGRSARWYGDDYMAVFQLPRGGSPANCKQQCDATPGCVGVTVFDDGAVAATPCYLYDAAGVAVAVAPSHWADTSFLLDP